MGQSTHSSTAARLGTRLRGQLASAYSVRGHQNYNLWYVYSPKSDRDWVLAGDLAWAHFLYTESDPLVRAVEYSTDSAEVRAGANAQLLRCDAIVTFADGVVEWRHVCRSDGEDEADGNALAALAVSNGARYVVYTEREIFACKQRIENWARVVAWLASVRGRSLQEEMMAVAALVDARGSVSIAEIQDGISQSEGVCRTAAAFKAVQNGEFASDLDAKPLTKYTCIRRIE